MRLTNTARSIIVKRMIDFSIEVGKQPTTIGNWLYIRPFMFLKLENYIPLKKYAQTDNIDDLLKIIGDYAPPETKLQAGMGGTQ